MRKKKHELQYKQKLWTCCWLVTLYVADGVRTKIDDICCHTLLCIEVEGKNNTLHQAQCSSLPSMWGRIF